MDSAIGSGAAKRLVFASDEFTLIQTGDFKYSILFDDPIKSAALLDSTKILAKAIGLCTNESKNLKKKTSPYVIPPIASAYLYSM